MNRRVWMWTAFVTASMMKWAGATWDMAWHFRQVNDANSPAHLINLAGNILLGIALVLAWRTREDAERGPFKVIGTGIGLAFLAVPLDQLWHAAFGLDLTTWSPTHLLLFSGTAVMGIGFVLLWLAQGGWTPGARIQDLGWSRGRWTMLGFLCFRVFSIVLFPAAFNEYAAVAAINFLQGFSIYPVDQEIADFAATVTDLAYDDLPHALYPAYTLAVTMLMVFFAHRLTGVPFFGTAIAAFYVLTRIVSDSVLGATDWPVAALPVQHILVAALVDGAIRVRDASWERAVLGATAGTLGAYLYWNLSWRVWYTVPFDLATMATALPIAMLAALAGSAMTWPRTLRWAAPAATA